jgi:hypothetical protein
MEQLLYQLITKVVKIFKKKTPTSNIEVNLINNGNGHINYHVHHHHYNSDKELKSKND